MSRADLIVIPMQPSVLDGDEAAKAIKHVLLQEKSLRRKIPYAIVFTRTSAAIRPRTQADVQKQVTGNSVPHFQTHIRERDAYRAMFLHGRTLDTLTQAQAGTGLAGAVENARAFAAELVEMLRETSARVRAA